MKRVIVVIMMLFITACSDSSDSPAASTQAQSTTRAATAEGRPSGRPSRTPLVELYSVQRQAVALDRVRTGTLRATKRLQLFAQEEGILADFPWFPGDRVQQGERLATLDASILRAQMTRVQAQLDSAERDFERAQTLSQRNLIAIEELQQRETALALARADVNLLATRLSFTRLSAPFTGVVSERLIEPGSYITRNTHLLTLIDPDSIVVDVNVSEQVIANLQTGDPAIIRLDAHNQTDIEARVLRIYPEVDPVSRQGRIEILPLSLPSSARSGQLARVNLTAQLPERIMIPFAAIRSDGEPYVYVVDNNNIVTKRMIETGIRMADRIEILSGLNLNERVVTRGFMGLREGQTVQTVNSTNEDS